MEVERRDGAAGHPRPEVDHLEAGSSPLRMISDENEDQARPLPLGDREQRVRASLPLDEQVLGDLGAVAHFHDAWDLGVSARRRRWNRLEIRDQVLAALSRRDLGVNNRGQREAGPAEDRFDQGDREAPLDLEQIHGSAPPHSRVNAPGRSAWSTRRNASVSSRSWRWSRAKMRHWATFPGRYLKSAASASADTRPVAPS